MPALANSVVNPLGAAPAKAYFLMARGYLDLLNKNNLQTLVLEDDIGNTLTMANLVFVRSRNLSPGAANDKNSLHLVEAADSRWRCHNPFWHVPIAAYYNIRAPGWGQGSTLYYASSLNAGSAWTWQTMVQNIWNLMSTQLGTAPALPITPDGTPEGWSFPGMSAWVALNVVLQRIGCAVKCDLTQAAGSQYGIVQIGAADTTQTTLQATLQTMGRKLWDEEFQEAVRGKEPYGCRVFFHGVQQDFGTERSTAQSSSQYLTNIAVYHIDVAGPDTATAEPGTYHEIWDDLPALYDATGALQNSTALNSRATDRTNAYYLMLRSPGGSYLNKIYSCLAAFYAGSTIKGVNWRQDDSNAWVTEIINHPFRMLMGLDQAGHWLEDDQGSFSIQPPDFRPTFPLYPPMPQVGKIATAAADGSGRFDSKIQLFDPIALTWTDEETVYLYDVQGATTLTVGDRYLARLNGYSGGRPLYEISTGPHTITWIITFNQPVVFIEQAVPPGPYVVGEWWLGTDCNFYYWCGPCDWEWIFHEPAFPNLKKGTYYYYPLATTPASCPDLGPNSGAPFTWPQPPATNAIFSLTTGPDGNPATQDWPTTFSSTGTGVSTVVANAKSLSVWFIVYSDPLGGTGSNFKQVVIQINGTQFITWDIDTKRFAFYDGSYHFYTVAQAYAVWHNVVLVNNAGVLDMYVDTVKQSFAIAPITQVNNPSIIAGGAYQFPPCGICKLYWTDQVLSACDIINLYNGGVPVDYPFLTPLEPPSGGTGVTLVSPGFGLQGGKTPTSPLLPISFGPTKADAYWNNN